MKMMRKKARKKNQYKLFREEKQQRQADKSIISVRFNDKFIISSVMLMKSSSGWNCARERRKKESASGECELEIAKVAAQDKTQNLCKNMPSFSCREGTECYGNTYRVCPI